MVLFATLFPEGVTGAAILAAKVASGVDAFNPAADFIIKMDRKKGFFHVRISPLMFLQKFFCLFPRCRHGRLKAGKRDRIMFIIQ